ncbi:MAG: hypothetical protein IPK26_05975 [Planctomycetes bacterium]|nr:hypothetical protein [Planctomycetota bacterium]
MKFRVVDRLVYWLARLVIGIAARVPQGLGYGAAALLGRLYVRLDGKRRLRALAFLRTAFPQHDERQLLAVARAATGNVFKVPLDMARLTRLLARGGDLRAVVDTSQAQSILPVRGPYLALTAHLGSWEMAAVAMAHLAGRAHGIARVARNPLLQQWILDNRQRGGLHIHPRRGGLRDLAAAVRDGAVGLQVVDQHQRLRGVQAPFFGRMASCERAAASLALRQRYPIVVGVALRVGRGFRFRLIGAAPFVPESTGDKRADLVRTVTQINERIEAFIRMAPEQYLWLHDRYRTPMAEAPEESDATWTGNELD